MNGREDGLQRLLDFLNILNEKAIEFRLEQNAPDSISVSFALVGYRVEADFDVDMMHFSLFKGDEAVDTDVKKLLNLIEERQK
ncbi:MAG: hypothetical protein SFW09_01385 [Hyphomicrobiaceae bacterium]|nr:hypothetical protein [Hyphomicrobiaceae bacterium]